MKKYFIIVMLCLALSPKVNACSCGEYLLDLPVKEMGWTQSESERLSSISDLIFTGTLIDYYKVTEIRLSSLRNEYEEMKIELVFKLIKSYKGDSRDTIRIRTNYGSDACGFMAPKNSDCIIFAKNEGKGYYYTYRSDCCKSISKAWDEKRYTNYVNFLESILNMTDGKYDFKQTRSYWNGGRPDQSDTLALIRYEIRDGKLEGDWKVTDRKGRVLEEGTYHKGLQAGTWKVMSYFDDNEYGDFSTKTELITYQKGKPVRSSAIIKDEVFNYEAGVGERIYETVRIQKVETIYEYK